MCVRVTYAVAHLSDTDALILTTDMPGPIGLGIAMWKTGPKDTELRLTQFHAGKFPTTLLGMSCPKLTFYLFHFLFFLFFLVLRIICLCCSYSGPWSWIQCCVFGFVLFSFFFHFYHQNLGLFLPLLFLFLLISLSSLIFCFSFIRSFSPPTPPPPATYTYLVFFCLKKLTQPNHFIFPNM